MFKLISFVLLDSYIFALSSFYITFKGFVVEWGEIKYVWLTVLYYVNEQAALLSMLNCAREASARSLDCFFSPL